MSSILNIAMGIRWLQKIKCPFKKHESSSPLKETKEPSPYSLSEQATSAGRVSRAGSTAQDLVSCFTNEVSKRATRCTEPVRLAGAAQERASRDCMGRVLS